MEESALQAIYTGVYIFIFLVAVTVSLFLFQSVTEYSNNAYEYTKKIEDNATLVDVPVEQNLLLTPTEVLSYYYNYIVRDLYGEDDQGNIKYNVTIYTTTRDEYTQKTLSNNLEISEAMEAIGSDNKYVLRYESIDSSGVNITIQKATQAEIESLF